MRLTLILGGLFGLLVALSAAYAQSANLIKNPSAEEGTDGWEVTGAAIV